MLFGNRANAGGMGQGMRYEFYEDPVASGKVGHDIQTRIRWDLIKNDLLFAHRRRQNLYCSEDNLDQWIKLDQFFIESVIQKFWGEGVKTKVLGKEDKNMTTFSLDSNQSKECRCICCSCTAFSLTQTLSHHAFKLCTTLQASSVTHSSLPFVRFFIWFFCPSLICQRFAYLVLLLVELSWSGAQVCIGATWITCWAPYLLTSPCICRVSFEEAAKGAIKNFTLKTKQGPKTINMPIPAGERPSALIIIRVSYRAKILPHAYSFSDLE